MSVNEKYIRAKVDMNDLCNKILIGFLIGLALGVFFIFYVNSDVKMSVRSMLLIALGFGISLSGTPYMWNKLPKVYGLGPVSWLLRICKFSIAGISGVFVTPIMLVVRFIQVRKFTAAVELDKQLNPDRYYR